MVLKKKIANPKLDKGLLREYLLRLIYVEMLGHDASFGHVHAVKLSSDTETVSKKLGYLTTTLFINNASELIFLIVNTLQTDLKSDNSLVVCAALGAVCRLVNADVAPALVPNVVELLSHSTEFVRKKAVMALYSCYQASPELVEDLDGHLRRMLCDKDPSVMGTTLSVFLDVVRAAPARYRNLAPSFVSIQRQIIEGKLPKSYEYHKTPAPFIQIKMLKIFAVLGGGDKRTSEAVYEVVSESLRRANTGSTIGNAIVYECVKTVTDLYPNPTLLAACADIVSHFLKQPNNNLRYIGIDALAHIVKINSKFAQEHQMAVIDCLEDQDVTLKKKTLELLYKMTRASNVEVVVEKMIDFLSSTKDEAIREDVVSRVCVLAEKYAPDNEWFIETMTTVFKLGGDLVKKENAENLMALIAQGAGDDDEAADNELRASAVSEFIDIIEEGNTMPNLLLQVMTWVFGEYGALCCEPAQTMDLIVRIARLPYADAETVRMSVYALAKAACQSGAALTEGANQFLMGMVASPDNSLAMRAAEIQQLLLQDAGVRQAALPYDASCEDLSVEEALGAVVAAHVQQELQNGAAPYISAEIRNPDQAAKAEAPDALKYEAYEVNMPQMDLGPIEPLGAGAGGGLGLGGLGAAPEASGAGPEPALDLSGFGGAGGLPAAAAAAAAAAPAPLVSAEPIAASSEPTLRVTGPRKWGRPSVSQPATPAAAAAPQPVLAGGAPAVALGGAVEAAPPPEPAAPAVSEEKQRLANSLFGGGGGGSRSRASSRLRAQSQVKRAPAAAEPDLLGMLGGGAPAAPAAGGGDPMADLMGGTPQAAPQAAPQTLPAAAAGGFNLDALYGQPAAPAGGMAMPQQPAMGMQPNLMMGGMGMGQQMGMQQQQMQQQQQPPPQPPTAAKEDPFANLLG